jgi:hypothetical protein
MRHVRLSLIALLIGTSIPAQESAQRFVVFEEFMQPTCSICQTASTSVATVEGEMAGRPVAFLIQDLNTLVGVRRERWYAAYVGSLATVYLPLVMASGGHSYIYGPYQDFAAAFRTMIETEAARPPEAVIEAFWRRIDGTLRIYAVVQNTSRETLSSSLNGAAVTALVYEENTAAASPNVRAAPWVSVSPSLAPRATGRFIIDTGTLPEISAENMRALVFVEYRPRAGKAYDMLQAALALPAGIYSEPAQITASADPGQTALIESELSLTGPHVLTWTATSRAEWLSLVPSTGVLPALPAARIDPSHLSVGLHTGVIDLNATSEDGMSISTTVTVQTWVGVRPPRRRIAPVSEQSARETAQSEEAAAALR